MNKNRIIFLGLTNNIEEFSSIFGTEKVNQEILENSKYKDSKDPYKPRKDKILKFHYFTNEVMVKNEKYSVYITIGEDRTGKLFYDLDKNKDFKE